MQELRRTNELVNRFQSEALELASSGSASAQKMASVEQKMRNAVEIQQEIMVAAAGDYTDDDSYQTADDGDIDVLCQTVLSTPIDDRIPADEIDEKLSRLSCLTISLGLRHFQSMIPSRNSAERQLTKASLHISQRWFGHSEPITAPAARLTHLFEPVDARAPQVAHMMHELRRLGHLLSVGWGHEPYADNDETILEAAIPDGARLTGPDLAMFKRWRREHDLVWVSELLRCDGLAPLASVTAAKAEASGALRVLIDRAIAGPTRVSGPRVGGPAFAACNGVRAGHWLFAIWDGWDKSRKWRKTE